jgi:hypothetical protein
MVIVVAWRVKVSKEIFGNNGNIIAENRVVFGRGEFVTL